jgi:Na+/H+ antiporter NhaC
MLALALRQVFISLFAGIWLGATFIYYYNPAVGLMRVLDHYVVNALADPDHTPIVLFTLVLGGMVGIIARSGGTQGIINQLSKMAKHPRGGQLATWLMGLFIFFDDYANTLIVGNTMRPITDRVRISREKLAYIVDSTAAPVVSIAVISTWIGFEMGLVKSTFQYLGLSRNIYLTFLQTIPYRFYCIMAVVFVFLIAASKRDFGPMLTAERRALRTGKLLRDNSAPLSDKTLSEITAPPGAPLRWYNAVIPILVVILVTLIGLWYNGRSNLISEGIQDFSLKSIIGKAQAFPVLMWSSFAGALTAGILAISQGILNLRKTLEAWISGVKSMIYAMVILVLAWSIGSICQDLHTADYVISITKGLLSPRLLPLMTFIIAAFISFATGTSWGTMTILVPIVIPMAYHFTRTGFSPATAEAILVGTIASVLSGAVFGDHCSPISDTTIMSSMASGSDHIDHVRTQIPYALAAGLVALMVGYLPAGFGLSPLISIPAGILLLICIVYLIGKKVDIKPSKNNIIHPLSPK